GAGMIDVLSTSPTSHTSDPANFIYNVPEGFLSERVERLVGVGVPSTAAVPPWARRAEERGTSRLVARTSFYGARKRGRDAPAHNAQPALARSSLTRRDCDESSTPPGGWTGGSAAPRLRVELLDVRDAQGPGHVPGDGRKVRGLLLGEAKLTCAPMSSRP